MTDIDLSEFTALGQPRRKPCPVAAAREKLSKPDQAKLEAALAAVDQVTPGAVVEWLRRKGVENPPNYGYVKSHRKLTCRCGESA
jgi:hypothetical protein